MKKVAIAALTSVLTLASCGGGSSAPAAAPQRTTAAAPAVAPVATQAAAPAAPAPAAAGPARKLAVSASNSLYSISTLEVKLGEKIEFVLTNTGDEKHNVVGVGEGVSLVSPDFDAGQTVSWTWTAPAKPMTFTFICAYHKELPPIQVSVK